MDPHYFWRASPLVLQVKKTKREAKQTLSTLNSLQKFQLSAPFKNPNSQFKLKIQTISSAQNLSQIKNLIILNCDFKFFTLCSPSV